MTLSYAVHRLSGVVSPANAAYSASELEFQLKNSGSTALFTVRSFKTKYGARADSFKCVPLLETALRAAQSAGIPKERVFILEMCKEFTGNKSSPLKTVEQLIEDGQKLPELEHLKWAKGQGARQVAYLCYSSGTSGLPVSK